MTGKMSVAMAMKIYPMIFIMHDGNTISNEDSFKYCGYQGKTDNYYWNTHYDCYVYEFLTYCNEIWLQGMNHIIPR